MRMRTATKLVPLVVLASFFLSLMALGDDKIDLEKEPKPLTKVQPVYPKEALKEHIEGLVHVGIFVDEKGNVVKAKIEKSDAPLLENAALDAARQWTFTPAIDKKDKKPVGVWLTIPFKFKLQEDGKEKKSDS